MIAGKSSKKNKENEHYPRYFRESKRMVDIDF